MKKKPAKHTSWTRVSVTMHKQKRTTTSCPPGMSAAKKGTSWIVVSFYFSRDMKVRWPTKRAAHLTGPRTHKWEKHTSRHCVCGSTWRWKYRLDDNIICAKSYEYIFFQTAYSHRIHRSRSLHLAPYPKLATSVYKHCICTSYVLNWCIREHHFRPFWLWDLLVLHSVIGEGS